MIISELFQEKLKEVKEDLAVGRIDAQARVFDKKKFDEIQTKIKKNPPIEPNLRRAIDVYNLKIQFVELRFENGKITGKRVRIPKKALPFESPELKRIIDAGMKIFNDGKNNEGCALDVYSIIQDDVKKLRERYLTPIKCRPEKSILIKEKKFYFKIEVDKINKKIEAEKLKLINDIDSEIERAKGKFERELNAFFLKKPPEEIGMCYSYEKIPGKINNYVKGLISTMKFPKAHEMVEGMKLKTHYYDLTWNDFSDQELIEEFGAKGILREDLNSIRELSKAIKEKK